MPRSRAAASHLFSWILVLGRLLLLLLHHDRRRPSPQAPAPPVVDGVVAAAAAAAAAAASASATLPLVVGQPAVPKVVVVQQVGVQVPERRQRADPLQLSEVDGPEAPGQLLLVAVLPTSTQTRRIVGC